MDKRYFEREKFSGAHTDKFEDWGAVQSSNFLNYWDVQGTTQSTKPSMIESHVATKVVDIERRLVRLEETISNLQEGVNNLIQENEITIRDIPYNQAKKEITRFFKENHGKNINAADVEEGLGIEFSMAVNICEELEKEGKVKET